MRTPAGAQRHSLTIVLVATLAVTASLAVAAWWKTRAANATERARADALAAASAATQAIFSYDYRSFDASVTNGKLFVIGDFATEYADTTATLKDPAVNEQAIVRAEVTAAGVVNASDREMEVLLYVNQYRQNANIDGEKVDQNRVVLTLVSTGDGWKVSRAIAI